MHCFCLFAELGGFVRIVPTVGHYCHTVRSSSALLLARVVRTTLLLRSAGCQCGQLRGILTCIPLKLATDGDSQWRLPTQLSSERSLDSHNQLSRSS